MLHTHIRKRAAASGSAGGKAASADLKDMGRRGFVLLRRREDSRNPEVQNVSQSIYI